MKHFFKEALELPYKSNSQDNPLHEQQVEELLIKHGFDYVAQPNGIQASPDFRVTLDNGRIVDIEIQAPDVHAALNMAKSQYGEGNVLGAPMLVR